MAKKYFIVTSTACGVFPASWGKVIINKSDLLQLFDLNMIFCLDKTEVSLERHKKCCFLTFSLKPK